MMVRGKTGEAERVFKKIAKSNKKVWPDVKLKKETEREKTVSAKYLFRPCNILTSTLIQSIAW